VTGKSLNQDEFVTCGGVPLDEVNFKTMASKVCPGLFFAGELLDIDGVTGGFNFQAAWTTGFVAGQALARAGAFDSLGKNRRQMVEGADTILAAAQSAASERDSGQVSLFGGGSQAKAELRLPQVADWPPHERLGEEFDAMGFYLSGHPLDQFRVALKRLQAVTFAEVLEDRRSSSQPVLAGTVIKKNERRGKNDQMYAFVSFSDPTGMYEVMFFSEVLAASRHLLDAGHRLQGAK